MGWFFRILIGIFWVGWFYFWIWVTRILCVTVILCAPPLTLFPISNTIREGLEDTLRLRNVSREVKDSINAHSRSKNNAHSRSKK